MSATNVEPTLSAEEREVLDAARQWAKSVPRSGFVKPGTPAGRLFDAVKALELTQ